MHFVLPLLSYEDRLQGAETSPHTINGETFRVPPNVTKGILYLYCNTAYGTACSAAVHVQGGPDTANSNAWLTSIPMFVSQNPTGGVVGSAALTAVTAGVLQVRFLKNLPPFIRAVHVLTGSATADTKLGVKLVLTEG